MEEYIGSVKQGNCGTFIFYLTVNKEVLTLVQRDFPIKKLPREHCLCSVQNNLKPQEAILMEKLQMKSRPRAFVALALRKGLLG